MANTTNLNMVKPAGTDHALISVINSNMDIIDGAVGALPSGSTLQGEIDSANTAIGTLNTQMATKAASGTSLNCIGAATFTRTGNVIIVQVDSFSSLPNGGWTNVCNIPSGYVPGANINIDVVQNTNDQCSGFQLIRFRVNASGILQTYNYGSALTYSNSHVTLSYIV